MWCIQKIDEQYRSRMYDILDLYQKAYDPKRPVICVDEKSKQLLEQVRETIQGKPGKPAKIDYEYKRNGTRNIFVAVEPLAGRRKVSVTETRKKTDFARFINALSKSPPYREATSIRIVLDNLNTHFEKSFIETFGEKKAAKILARIEFYYTPKHASWLNMAEIEINALETECLRRRIATAELLENEVYACVKSRNEKKRKIVWTFTRQKADTKLSKHYV